MKRQTEANSTALARRPQKLRGRRFGSRRRGNRRAVAIVEFACVLPLLLLILLGTLESTSMIYRQQTISIAAYEGCRVALIPKITRGQVDAAINQIMTDRRIRNAQITIIPNDFVNAPAQTVIEVRVTAPAAGNSIIAPRFFANRSLTGSCFMMKEF
jgi:Flp pilus assembly protein TadG